MYCTDFKVEKLTKERKRHVVANIVASSVPGTMPTNGANIDNLKEDDILDPGTKMLIVENGDEYVMNEENTFVKQ